MNKTVITLSSVTYAMKLANQLRRKNIEAEVVKVDSSKTKNGCTYGVKIQMKDIYEAVNILKQLEIPYSLYNDI